MDTKIIFPPLPKPHHSDPAPASGGATGTDYFTTEQTQQFARDTVAIQPARAPDLTTQGMADCMDMVRTELIEAGVIDPSTPPMMVANAVLARIQMLTTPAPKLDDTVPRAKHFALTTETRAERILQSLACPYTQAAWGENWRPNAHAWNEAIDSAKRAIRADALAAVDAAKAQPAHAALIRGINAYANAYRADDRERTSLAYDSILLELFDKPVLKIEKPVDDVAEGALPDRDVTKPAEQQGLFRKFDVERVDGSDEPGGKHHGCFNFVLDVDHDKHAPAAMRAYAASCRHEQPKLAQDIIDRVGLLGTPEATLFAQGHSGDVEFSTAWIHEAAKKHSVSYTGNYEMTPGGMLMFAKKVEQLLREVSAQSTALTPLYALISKYAEIRQRHADAYLKIEAIGGGWLVNFYSNSTPVYKWLTSGLGATVDEACAAALNDYHEEVTG
jgi:hypothetical protein